VVFDEYLKTSVATTVYYLIEIELKTEVHKMPLRAGRNLDNAIPCGLLRRMARQEPLF
jgi:hypothetical protein